MENTKAKINDPLIRIVRKDDLDWKKKALVRLICIGVGVLLCIICLWIIGRKNPFGAVSIMIQGTFGNKAKFYQTLQDTVFLLGIAIALCPAYQMKFWNVGAQGQILMGALGASISLVYFASLPNWAVIFLALVLALLFGGIWGLIPAFFKAKWNTNETLFTLMMNYVAIQLVSFFVMVWQGTKSGLGLFNTNNQKGWLPTLFGSSVFLPLIVVLILVVFMYVYITKTKHGYELKVIGESLNTARYTGIKVKWVIMRTLILSGVLCGLIGFIYVSGVDHTISSSTSGSYGFTAIIVCWLSNFNPFLMIIYAFVIAFLNRGGINLKNKNYSTSLNEYSCELLVFIIIISIMLSEFFIRYKLVIRHSKKDKAVEEAVPSNTDKVKKESK